MATDEEIRLSAWLKRAARSLGKAAIWPATGRIFTAERDYIFEFYCFLRMIRDLQVNYRIDYVPGSGKTIHCFPRKPANKSGRPRFDLYDKGTGQLLWQFCLGTKIKDVYGRRRAPDISLQLSTASEDDPTHSDVQLAWDAKFKRERGMRISDADIACFSQVVEFMGLRGRAVPAIRFDQLLDLVCNGLISNGDISTESDAGLRHLNIREVSAFFPGRPHASRP